MLLALVGMALVLAAVWLIRESFLYESTDDAQVDGRVMPLSAQITGQSSRKNDDVILCCELHDFENQSRAR
jgi:hypothetical protein